jgi:hypothetical protein
MMKKILVFSLAVLLGMVTYAQEKLTEGKITMTQTMSTDNAQMQAMLDQTMGGKSMETVAYVKGNKSRSEVSNPMSGNIVTIFDMDKKEMLLLMDNAILGKKYSTTIITKEEEEKMKENTTIVKGTETKTILGYECTKQTVTVDQDGANMVMEMYITDKIAPVVSQQTSFLGNKLEGLPMYMVIKMNQQGMNMTITTEVTNIEKETVSDDKFSLTPPEGYTKMEGM